MERLGRAGRGDERDQITCTGIGAIVACILKRRGDQITAPGQRARVARTTLAIVALHPVTTPALAVAVVSPSQIRPKALWSAGRALALATCVANKAAHHDSQEEEFHLRGCAATNVNAHWLLQRRQRQRRQRAASYAGLPCASSSARSWNGTAASAVLGGEPPASFRTLMRGLAGVRTLCEAKCGARAGASRREAARTAECSRAVERKPGQKTARVYRWSIEFRPHLSRGIFCDRFTFAFGGFRGKLLGLGVRFIPGFQERKGNAQRRLD